nr:DUF3238 domain-containing protein [Alkalibacillus almallahensis]
MAGAGEDLSRYTVDVAAQNPLVSDAAPPLSIDIEPLNIYSDGSVSMSGSHSQFPSFGVYRQDDNSSWKWLYNYSHGNKDPSDIYWEEYF